MRHLRSILYASVLAPAVWVFSAVGSDRGSLLRVLLLVLAGAAYAILLLAPISPAGPLLAGVVLLGLAGWAAVAPGSYASVWGDDLGSPGLAPAALLAVPLLGTALNARRWNRFVPPEVPLIGVIGAGSAPAPQSGPVTQSGPVLGAPLGGGVPPLPAPPPLASYAGGGLGPGLPLSPAAEEPTTVTTPARSGPDPDDEPTMVALVVVGEEPTIVQRATDQADEPTAVHIPAAQPDEPTVIHTPAAQPDEPTVIHTPAAQPDEPTAAFVAADSEDATVVTEGPPADPTAESAAADTDDQETEAIAGEPVAADPDPDPDPDGEGEGESSDDEGSDDRDGESDEPTEIVAAQPAEDDPSSEPAPADLDPDGATQALHGPGELTQVIPPQFVRQRPPAEPSANPDPDPDPEEPTQVFQAATSPSAPSAEEIDGGLTQRLGQGTVDPPGDRTQVIRIVEPVDDVATDVTQPTARPPSILEQEREDPGADPTTLLSAVPPPPAPPDRRRPSFKDMERPADEVADDTRRLIPVQRTPQDQESREQESR